MSASGVRWRHHHHHHPLMMVTFSVLLLVTSAQAANVFELIEQTPDLSEFLKLVKSDSLMTAIMQQEEGTVFAPTNQAMKQFAGEKNYQLLKYHTVNLAWPMNLLREERAVASRLKGSQSIFVTESTQNSRSRQPNMMFVNNARIVRGDLRAYSSQDRQSQILHIIDQVLVPTTPNTKHSKYFNPSALDLLANAAKYDLLAGNTVSLFYAKIRQFDQTSVFDSDGYNTFFIPIDESFNSVRERVDGAVIQGHVVPDHVMFSSATDNSSMPTLSNSATLRVTARMLSGQLPGQQNSEFYDVQSRTLVGDIQYPVGSVLTRVVKGNIAVKNGVVHLISKPLMITNSDVFTFVKDNHEQRVHGFMELMKQHEAFANTVMTAKQATLFIPSNEAIDRVQNQIDALKTDKTRFIKLLNLHLVNRRVTSADVSQSAVNGVYSVSSSDSSRPLYLSVSGGRESRGDDPPHPPTLFVDGGGTNASVLVADLLASNGVVHIIDRVLGVPHGTVGDKLATNAVTSLTNSLANQGGFVRKVSRQDKNFTMFVPSNQAWQKIKKDMPATYNTLFKNHATAQASKILDRHLIIGKSYSIEQLADMSKKEGYVMTFRSKFKIDYQPGSNEYTIKWKKLQGRVSRANLECTNGYVHVIDSVMMVQRDVTTSSATYTTVGSTILLAMAIAMLRL